MAAMAVAGALIGVTGALFLKALRIADLARVALIDAAVKHSVPGWLAAAIAGLTGAAVAVWLAHRYAPDAPQLSESENPEASESPTSIPGALTVNFAGAGLAVGAGLALGPERPAIQMGGAIGRMVSRIFGLSRPDHELLMAATGGAGVATMFNSPLGCAAYTVETVLRRADLRISMTTLGVGAVAVAVTRALVGRNVNFVVEQMPVVPFEHLILCLGLGCVIAVLANIQVRVIMMLTKLFLLVRVPDVVRGALIGGGIGLLAWFSPNLVGVGDALTQGVLDGRFALWAMGFIFLVRFFLGPLSLAGGTPGGYFTPVLLLGALLGAMYGIVMGAWLPIADVSPTAFALIGMAVALASIARAPFTGVLLVMETTGAFAMSLPMIIAVIGATVVTRMLRTPSLSYGLELALAASRKHRRFRAQQTHQHPMDTEWRGI